MPDNFIIDNLHGIIDSIELIEIRFAGIAKSDDFVMNADGVLILDSICRRLQIIGEFLKNQLCDIAIYMFIFNIN